MAIGTIGITRPADVNINDIDIYYNYTPNRETLNSQMFKIEADEVLSYAYLPDDGSDDENYDDNFADNPDANILEGLYNLRLPSEIFDELGIYTIYIKPRMLTTIINDCGVLSALPTVKGIVIDINDGIPEELQPNNALQGYRIEYLNSDGSKLRNVVRYVTSSNKVTPIQDNVGNTSQKATRYRFDDSGTLLFLQVTPSSSSDVKPNAIPYIGNPGDIIRYSNTNFSPVVLEVEMVENTIDTIANIIAGEQIKDVQNGILTYYDENRDITKQFNLYKIKSDISGDDLFEVKEKRTNIREDQNFDDITDDVN
ncbi:MAG: hypothetical protein ACOC22_00245 [bacterium]